MKYWCLQYFLRKKSSRIVMSHVLFSAHFHAHTQLTTKYLIVEMQCYCKCNIFFQEIALANFQLPMCRSSASRNNYVDCLRASFDQSPGTVTHTHSCVAVYSASITRTIITCAINCLPVMGILPRELPN